MPLPDKHRPCAGNVASYIALLLWKRGWRMATRRPRPRPAELWHACGGAAASWTLLAYVLTAQAMQSWPAVRTTRTALRSTPWQWWLQLLLSPAVSKPEMGDGWSPGLSLKDVAAMTVAVIDLGLTVAIVSWNALLPRMVGILTGIAAGLLIAARVKLVS